jgi:hypothetical protein
LQPITASKALRLMPIKWRRGLCPRPSPHRGATLARPRPVEPWKGHSWSRRSVLRCRNLGCRGDAKGSMIRRMLAPMTRSPLRDIYDGRRAKHPPGFVRIEHCACSS